MQLIVGLGNPGAKYEWTRHNVGFLVIDELARRGGRDVRTPEAQSLTATVRLGDTDALIVKPQTFMNLSGVAVAALKTKHSISDPPLIISDDIALPFGKLRIRREGSAGGHNGLKSIIEKLGHQNFPRLRFGIAPEHPVRDMKRFVLEEFSRAERESLPEIIARAADAVETFLTKGIAEAMSKYN